MQKEEEEEKKRVWWVKNRKILNHTVIFEDLSIPHMYLGAQGFRYMLLFSCLCPKTSLREGVFLPVFQSLHLAYIWTHTCTMRLLIHRKPRERRLLQTLPPTVFPAHCFPAARGKCLREALQRQPPDATFCNSTHTGCVRTSRPNAITKHLHNGCWHICVGLHSAQTKP